MTFMISNVSNDECDSKKSLKSSIVAGLIALLIITLYFKTVSASKFTGAMGKKGGLSFGALFYFAVIPFSIAAFFYRSAEKKYKFS